MIEEIEKKLKSLREKIAKAKSPRSSAYWEGKEDCLEWVKKILEGKEYVKKEELKKMINELRRFDYTTYKMSYDEQGDYIEYDALMELLEE